jgi:hypothetical protein
LQASLPWKYAQEKTIIGEIRIVWFLIEVVVDETSVHVNIVVEYGRDRQIHLKTVTRYRTYGQTMQHANKQTNIFIIDLTEFNGLWYHLEIRIGTAQVDYVHSLKCIQVDKHDAQLCCHANNKLLFIDFLRLFVITVLFEPIIHKRIVVIC